MIHQYYIPSVNLMGAGAISEIGNQAKTLGCTKALIVTDKVLQKLGIIDTVIILFNTTINNLLNQ